MISSEGESPPRKDTSGNISSIFDRKTQGEAHPRFSELKKTIWKDSMTQSWQQVLGALKEKVELIESIGSKAGGLYQHPFLYAKVVTR